MAGPLSPPSMFDSFGFLVSTSTAVARNVLTSDSPSDPPSWALAAISSISVTFGESLVIIGRELCFLDRLTME